MQSVAVDHANPQPGEEAFILQLCLPETPGADGGALMDKIGSFVSLYLGAAQPDGARFAQMGGLTWVIAAPGDAAASLDQVRADLARTLYGQDDGTQVQLEWPEGVVPQVSDAADADPAFEADEADEDVWAINDAPEAEDQADTEAGLEPLAEPSADEVDLDAFEIDEPPANPDAEPVSDVEPAALDLDREDTDEVFLVDEAADSLDEDEFDIESDPAGLAAKAPIGEADGPAESDDWRIASAAERAAFDDSNEFFEIDALDIEIVDGPGLASDPATDAPIDVDLDAPLEIEGLDDLTEAPERPGTSDIAAELSAFRAEMREIAASIPGAAGDDVLAAFRAEMDSIAGTMGQRVDGAAQRIESAADRVVEQTSGLNGERLIAAAERAEASAKLLETGVSDALSVLSAAARAMSEPAFLTASKTSR